MKINPLVLSAVVKLPTIWDENVEKGLTDIDIGY